MERPDPPCRRRAEVAPLTIAPDGALTAGLDVDAEEGTADTGNVAEDMTDLFVAIGDAAQDRQTGVAFLIDEVQYLSTLELEALIAALHRIVQRRLPLTLVGAGLPQLPRLAGEAKSYAERLFKFPQIGRLSDPEAELALVQPAQDLGVDYEPEGVDVIVAYTEGYPYFLQEYGKIVWDLAPEGEPIARRTSEQLGPTRARLIEKGLIYTTGHGQGEFTVPQFDRYMRRSYELIIPEPRRGKR